MKELASLMQLHFAHSKGRDIYRLGVGIIALVQTTGTRVSDLDCLVVFDPNHWRLSKQKDARGSEDIVDHLHLMAAGLSGEPGRHRSNTLVGMLTLLLESPTGQMLEDHPHEVHIISVEANTVVSPPTEPRD
jgi:hypothetical protein